MNESRLDILQQLAAGDLDIDEAERRLGALGDAEEPASPGFVKPASTSMPPKAKGVGFVKPALSPLSPQAPTPPTPPIPPAPPVAPTPPTPPAPPRSPGRPRREFEAGWDIRESELREALAELGIEDVGPAQLHAMRIHEVGPGFVRGLIDADVTIDAVRDLTQLRIHGVEPAYAAEMQDIFDGIRAQELTHLAIHEVAPGFAREVQEHFEDLGVEQVIQLAIHDFKPYYAARLADLFEDLRFEEVRDLTVHDVPVDDLAQWVQLLEEAGYEDLRPDDLLQLHIHGVSAEVLADLLRNEDEDADGRRSVGRLVHRLLSGEV